MPIEIRELVIRATIEQGLNEDDTREFTQSESSGRANQELIVQMEELKKIIQEKNER